MTDKLGILVTTEKYKKEVIGIARAAMNSNRDVTIFMIDDGVFLLRDSGFVELLNEGVQINCCDHSRQKRGVERKVDKIKYGSQYQNAVMVHESDRVLVF